MFLPVLYIAVYKNGQNCSIQCLQPCLNFVHSFYTFITLYKKDIQLKWTKWIKVCITLWWKAPVSQNEQDNWVKGTWFITAVWCILSNQICELSLTQNEVIIFIYFRLIILNRTPVIDCLSLLKCYPVSNNMQVVQRQEHIWSFKTDPCVTKKVSQH